MFMLWHSLPVSAGVLHHATFAELCAAARVAVAETLKHVGVRRIVGPAAAMPCGDGSRGGCHVPVHSEPSSYRRARRQQSAVAITHILRCSGAVEPPVVSRESSFVLLVVPSAMLASSCTKCRIHRHIAGNSSLGVMHNISQVHRQRPSPVLRTNQQFCAFAADRHHHILAAGASHHQELQLAVCVLHIRRSGFRVAGRVGATTHACPTGCQRPLRSQQSP